MKNLFIATSMLAYLSCAAQEQTNTFQVPVIELHNDTITYVEEIEKEKHPAEIAAEFVIKTLEEKMREHPDASYAGGSIDIGTSSRSYDISYKFDPTDVCKVGSDKVLFKGALFIHFMDYVLSGEYAKVGNGTANSIDFETVPPFYPATMFSFHHAKLNPNNHVLKDEFYPAFSEAQKLHQDLLLYIAERLKHKPEKIEIYEDRVLIHHRELKIGNEKEENVFKSYNEFIDALPAQQPYQPGKEFILLSPCKP